jgi:hypothetical protein
MLVNYNNQTWMRSAEAQKITNLVAMLSDGYLDVLSDISFEIIERFLY